MQVIAILVPLSGARTLLNRLADEKKILDNDNRVYFMAEKLAWKRPRFPDATEAAATRLMPIDNVMAAHLTFFIDQYREFEVRIKTVELAYTRLRSGEKLEADAEAVRLNSKSATLAFHGAADHGEFAAALLAKFVLSKIPTFRILLASIGLDHKVKAAAAALREEA